jgi:DNA-binding SARP family transcriptional activator/tetratricopeptide (TPR) repeat protein
MAEDPSRLEVRLLGPPDITVDGRPMRTDTKKAVALLAYLVHRETAPSRDHLVELLWPDSDPERGRGALRRTISTLRSALGGRWVEADRERVTLDRTDLWVDTAALERGHRDALELVRGGFLEGFWLRDAPEFDDWQMATAEHYGRLFRRILVEAIDSALDGHDAVRGVALGERLVALDPIDETGHRALMRAHAAAGDRVSATRQFRKCVSILETELGVAPLPETVELHESILGGGGVGRMGPRVESAAPRGRTALPFLERQREVAELRSLTSVPGVVAVAGPLGSGRSRLLAEALPDAIVARAHAGESELPHALTRSLLDAALRVGDPQSLGEAAAPAAHLHPGLARRSSPAPDIDNELGPVVLLAGVAAALAGLAGDRPVVVDDFDLADPASAGALNFVAGRAQDLGLRLVLVTSEPQDRRVTLGPLSPEMVAGVAGEHGLDPEGLLATTGGLPGALAEILADPTPGEALERVRARSLDGLDAIDHQVLEGLVVLGSSDPGRLSAVTGRSQEEVLSSLDRLITAGLAMDTDPHGVPTWVSALVMDRLGAGRQALLHSRAAEALLGRVDPESLAARAWHLHRAGRGEEAAEAHAHAGRAAARIHAHDTARTHLQAALAVGHDQPGTINRSLGGVERSAGRYAEAISAYHAAAAHGTDADLERRIGDVYRRWGRLALADAALSSAEVVATDRELPLVLADRAEIAFRQGAGAVASELIESALLATPDDPAVASRVRNVAGLVRGDPSEFELAIAAARQGSHREEEAAALNNLALALLDRGEGEIALDHAGRALALLSNVGDRHRRAAVHGNLADIHHAMGNDQESRRHLVLAVELFAEIGIEPGGWEPEIWKLTSW